MSEAFNRDEYEQICAVLARFYNIIITDSGTGLVHSAMEGTLALAGHAGGGRGADGGRCVPGVEDAGLGWVAHGYAEQVADAVVVLCCEPGQPGDRPRTGARALRGSLPGGGGIPYDPHLATGGRLDLGAMRDPTQIAFLELGAHIADRFGS